MSGRPVFRRAVVTDEVSQEPGVAIRLALKFHLDGLEIRSLWNKGPHELTPAEVRTLRTMIGDAGLAVCAVATPCFKCSLDNLDEVRAHLDILRRCQHLCAELEAPIGRIFTFWRHEDGIWDERAAAIADRLVEAAEIAQAGGLRLGVENEPSVWGSNAARVADLLRRAAHPALGAIWDPCNDVYDPEGERPFPDGYVAVRSRIVHVHLKDARKDPQSGAIAATALGDGDIPFPAIFSRLTEDGYSGFVSLETHYRIGGPLSDEVMRLPRGAAFSAGGEEASKLCLQRWAGILAAMP